MPANVQKKAVKGSVQVKDHYGYLRLMFRVNGKRYFLSLGLPDTQMNRKVAEAGSIVQTMQN